MKDWHLWGPIHRAQLPAFQSSGLEAAPHKPKRSHQRQHLYICAPPCARSNRVSKRRIKMPHNPIYLHTPPLTYGWTPVQDTLALESIFSYACGAAPGAPLQTHGWAEKSQNTGKVSSTRFLPESTPIPSWGSRGLHWYMPFLFWRSHVCSGLLILCSRTMQERGQERVEFILTSLSI